VRFRTTWQTTSLLVLLSVRNSNWPATTAAASRMTAPFSDTNTVAVSSEKRSRCPEDEVGRAPATFTAISSASALAPLASGCSFATVSSDGGVVLTADSTRVFPCARASAGCTAAPSRDASTHPRLAHVLLFFQEEYPRAIVPRALRRESCPMSSVPLWEGYPGTG